MLNARVTLSTDQPITQSIMRVLHTQSQVDQKFYLSATDCLSGTLKLQWKEVNLSFFKISWLSLLRIFAVKLIKLIVTFY